MTKDEFLSGVSFKVKGPSYKGADTYTFDGTCIIKESRSSIDDKILIRSYHVNVKTIGKLDFKGFTYVMEKRINVKYKFEDLVIFDI